MPPGTYTFKGSYQPLEMAHFLLEDLASRCKHFPANPPKGKGNRLHKASAEIGSACIQLPMVVELYKVRFQVGVWCCIACVCA